MRDIMPIHGFGRIALPIVLLGIACPSLAQRVRVGPDTQLRTIRFHFDAGRSFSDAELRKQLAETELGKHTTLRSWFRFLPFVDPVEPAPFDPLELQRDVVRLRAFYQRAGFPQAAVRYTVTPDGTQDRVDVRFEITEGRPLRLAALTIEGPGAAPPSAWLPSELLPAWKDFGFDTRENLGKRCGENEQLRIEKAVRQWLQDRGYPKVEVRSEASTDLAAHTVDLRVGVEPGLRARFGTIEVVGNEKVDAAVVRKAITFGPGDWYSASKLAEAQRDLINLNLFHLVVPEVPPQESDSTVDVRMRVEEGKARQIAGDIGYLSDGGITGRGEWSHRNFFGGARTFTFSILAQTGVWALEDNPDRLARASVSLTQRGVFERHTSLVTTPYFDYRDDARDRSGSFGVDATLLYNRDSWVRTLSLKYAISSRRVYDYRSGLSDDVYLFSQVQAVLDSTGRRTRRSAVTLATMLGTQDDPVRPRRLLLFRPSAEITAPEGWNTAQYSRLDLNASFQRPTGRGTVVRGRASIGRVWPFGKSAGTLAGADAVQRYLDLRDYLFTAGGTGDVRGWDSQMLGPKTPDYFVPAGADSTDLHADRYVPIGGLMRFGFSAEMRAHFPGLSSEWGVDGFLDGGRVWSPDTTYAGANLYDQNRFFWSTGLGVDRDTPVGPIRVSLAYKLNPSLLDVLLPQEFIDDKRAGTLGQRPYPWVRRLQFHLAIGAAF